MRSTFTAVAVLLAAFAASSPAVAQPAPSAPSGPVGAPAPAAPSAQRPGQPAHGGNPAAAGAAGAPAQPAAAPAHRAANRAQPAKAPDEDEDDPSAGTPRPAKADIRSGQLTLSAGLGFAVPMGGLTGDLAATDAIAIGPSVGGAVAYGLSRYVALAARAGYTSYGAADRPSKIPTNPDAVRPCATCTGTGFDLGLGLVYHAVQALAFDPWMSFGVGWRSTKVTLMPGDLPGDPAEAKLGGLDVARIGLGGDFFPLRSFGIGMDIDLAVGTNVDRPSGQPGAVYAVFGVGLRLTLDPIGAVSSPRAAVTGRAGPRRPANN